MWTLQEPWFELIIRAMIIFSFLFLVFRFWGKKHFGQLSTFDLLLLIIISEALQNSLIGEDKSIPGAMIVVLTLVFLNVLLNRLSFHSKKMEELIDGIPRVLIKDGEVDKELLKIEVMTIQELEEALRMKGALEIKDVKLAMLETNGKVSVIKK